MPFHTGDISPDRLPDIPYRLLPGPTLRMAPRKLRATGDNVSIFIRLKRHREFTPPEFAVNRLIRNGNPRRNAGRPPKLLHLEPQFSENPKSVVSNKLGAAQSGSLGEQLFRRKTPPPDNNIILMPSVNILRRSPTRRLNHPLKIQFVAFPTQSEPHRQHPYLSFIIFYPTGRLKAASSIPRQASGSPRRRTPKRITPHPRVDTPARQCYYNC